MKCSKTEKLFSTHILIFYKERRAIKDYTTHIGISSLSQVNLLSLCFFQHPINSGIWITSNSSFDNFKEEICIKYLKLSSLRLLCSWPLIWLRLEKPLSHSTLEPGRTARIWQSPYKLVTSVIIEILYEVWIYVRSHI